MSNKANNVKQDLTMTFKFKLHLEAIIFCNFQEKKGRRGRGIINNQQSTINNQTTDWETISGGEGAVSKRTFIICVELRNHSPSLRAWLEYWRIDELLPVLEKLGAQEHVVVVT